MSDPFDIIPLVQPSMSERDWLMRLLEPLDFVLHQYEPHPKIVPGALYIYNSPARIKLSNEFLSGISQAGHCGLLHFGDEYLRAEPTDYQAFDYVVRMFPHDKLMGPGMYPLALGVSNDMGPRGTLPASEREHAWMFAGDWKSDRSAMARRFKDVPNGYLSLPRSFLGERGVSRDAYLSNMANSMFALCPAGNVCVETYRPYEALELGAIPLLPGRRFSNAFEDVMGTNPLPIFRSWGDAAEFVLKKLESPNELDALQSQCQEWWQEFQHRSSLDLTAFLTKGREGAYREALQQHIASTHISKFDRLIALIAQQNKRQLLERGKFNIAKVFRVVSGKRALEGTWSIQSPTPQSKPPAAKSEDSGASGAVK